MSTQALKDITGAYEAFRPPKRVSVSRGANESYYIRQPGGYVGPWSPEETPYIVEPMDMLASRKHESVVFVGPARSGKTAGLVLGWMAHQLVNDPGDSLIVSMTQDKARELSKTDFSRMLRYSPPVKSMMTSSGQDHNTFDCSFRHGVWIKIGWPTVSNLSGSTYRYVALTDYDRMDDTDEGSVFSLALKRTQTFMSRGMCMVESSPGREIVDPNWRPHTPHEAPPCTGILGIYNRSDRRRWYWPCPDCDEYFEAKPGLGLFNLPSDEILLEAVRVADLDELAREHSRVVCPHCGSLIGKTKKNEMNKRGRWVAEGQEVTPAGIILGESPRSNIAGYWLGGVAATYQSWHSIVQRYLQGLREYSLTGNELTLQSTTNTDQSMPYLSRAMMEGAKTSSGPDGRKDKTLNRFIVPDDARFIVAAVDVQGGQGARFIVQVHAIGPHLEQWPIDRYSITESEREGVDGGFAPIDPATHPEDWKTITNLILKATYRLKEDGKELRVRMVAIDTGGEAGVTDKSYEFYRQMRAESFHGRVMLVKGASTKTAPLIKESWVGAKKKDDKGDIPLYLLNTAQLKDAVFSGLRRKEAGPGFIHAPAWLPNSWFDELNAEVRKPDGSYMKIRARNEALDLGCYIRAACIRLGADRPSFWDAPPPWAMPLIENADVITKSQRQAMQEGTNTAVIRRRVASSSYLR